MDHVGGHKYNGSFNDNDSCNDDLLHQHDFDLHNHHFKSDFVDFE